MAKPTQITTASPAIIQTNGGQVAFIRGHKSSKKKAPTTIKDRKFRTAPNAAANQIDLDAQALDAVTAEDLRNMIAAKCLSYGLTESFLPVDMISEAVGVLVQRIENRRNNTGPKGPKVIEVVAKDTKGRKLIQAVQNQRTGVWTLELCNVTQDQSWFVNMTQTEIDSVDRFYKNEAARLFALNLDRAEAEIKKRETDPSVELKHLCSLINKVNPPKSANIRRFTLIGSGGEITCDSIAIGGQTFADMLSVVAVFRPDLLPLFEQ